MMFKNKAPLGATKFMINNEISAINKTVKSNMAKFSLNIIVVEEMH